MSIAVQIGLERMVSIELMGWRMHLGVSLGQWVAWCNSLLCHLCVSWDGCRMSTSRRRTMYRPCSQSSSAQSHAIHARHYCQFGRLSTTNWYL